MAQYRLNAYDADIYIPEFRGLMQYGDQFGEDLRFSPDCMDVETPGGVLQPVPPTIKIRLKVHNGTDTFFYSSSQQQQRNVTMMYAYVTCLGTAMTMNNITLTYSNGNEFTFVGSATPGERYWLYLFAIDDKLYVSGLKDSLRSYITEDVTGGVLDIYRIGSDTYARTKWSWCTYEHTYTSSGMGLNGTTNVIILSNPTDGVYIHNGLSLQNIESAPSKFQYIARYAERIWGVGTGDTSDTIYYSRPYDATNWTGATENDQPEDVAGDIREVTFDEDKLTALIPFGDSLVAFTRSRAWRITGTDPSNFVIQEQYGNGTKYPETIAVIGDTIIMLGDAGLVSYDGNTVTPFMKECTYEILRNSMSFDQQEIRPVAVKARDKYILALSNYIRVDNGQYQRSGYTAIIYNDTDKTFNQRNLPDIVDFCHDTETAYEVATDEGRHVDIIPFLYDSWDFGRSAGGTPKWTTPWVTLGRKDIQIGGFEVYIQPELKPKTGDSSVKFTIKIQTEKKTKTKEYTVSPIYNSSSNEKLYKVKRLHFGGGGRRFRMLISVDAGLTNTVWRLSGGIHIIAEIDKD